MDIPQDRDYAAEIPSVAAKEEPVEKSPLFKKIDDALMNKVALFNNSYARYAARSMLATLFLTLGTAPKSFYQDLVSLPLPLCLAGRWL